MAPYLSLIIPAYNESERIENSLGQAVSYIEKKQLDCDIWVIDDGSTDNTCEVVEKFGHGVRLHKQPKNMGKGAAVRTGMLLSEAEIRLFTDADFSTPVYELAKVLDRIQKGADICIGSRAIDRTMVKEHQPFYREFMGKTFNKFVQLLVFRGITDTQCGFKAFTAKAAEYVFSRAKVDGFSFDVEALYLARKAGYRIDQVSVEWYNDERSTVHPIKDSMRMFMELFRIRSLHK